MMRSVEITTVLTGQFRAPGFHNLHWRSRIGMNLDCFICERTGRTTYIELGAERAVCSGDRVRGEHFTAARIAAFDRTEERERLTLRAVVDFWWAPFQDEKRDRAASALTASPWVRLHLGHHCPENQVSGEATIQSNMVRPVDIRCESCGQLLASSIEAPTIRLLN
ncbi:hypothetical protein [Kitasatospora sp. NBC_00039]|uniref:hypothetical protein n=1 Tax=Kitasatospora sp. NBC_00039 TaxID=2903565 RepID=UPI003249479B